MGLTTLTAMMLGLAVQAAVSPTLLQPSGKWSVDYRPYTCLLSRDFGTGPEKATLGITPAAIGNRVEVTIVSTDHANLSPDRGRATITIDAHEIAREYSSAATGQGRQRATRTALYRTEMTWLAQASTVTLPVSRNRSVTLAPTDIAAALKATDTCVEHLRKAEGIDGEVVEQATGNAIPIDWDDWLTADDYPVEAIRNDLEGRSVIAWIVEPDGKVSDCRAVRTTDSAVFDAQACRVIAKKGRYYPPVDAEGKPMTSRDGRLIRWRLPG